MSPAPPQGTDMKFCVGPPLMPTFVFDWPPILLDFYLVVTAAGPSSIVWVRLLEREIATCSCFYCAILAYMKVFGFETARLPF